VRDVHQVADDQRPLPVGDRLPVDERPVAAAQVPDQVATVALDDLGVQLADPRRRQHQLDLVAAPDAEGGLVDRHQDRILADVGLVRETRSMRF